MGLLLLGPIDFSYRVVPIWGTERWFGFPLQSGFTIPASPFSVLSL